MRGCQCQGLATSFLDFVSSLLFFIHCFPDSFSSLFFFCLTVSFSPSCSLASSSSSFFTFLLLLYPPLTNYSSLFLFLYTLSLVFFIYLFSSSSSTSFSCLCCSFFPHQAYLPVLPLPPHLSHIFPFLFILSSFLSQFSLLLFLHLQSSWFSPFTSTFSQSLHSSFLQSYPHTLAPAPPTDKFM